MCSCIERLNDASESEVHRRRADFVFSRTLAVRREMFEGGGEREGSEVFGALQRLEQKLGRVGIGGQDHEAQ